MWRKYCARPSESLLASPLRSFGRKEGVMKNWNIAAGLLSVLILPNFAPPERAKAIPADSASVASNRSGEKPRVKGDNYPSNVGAVNEGGGSANTSGMNKGLSPNSSGSGTMNSRAGDTSGFSFGTGADKDSDKGAVNPAQER